MRALLIFVILLALSSKALFAQELEKVSLQLQWLHQFQFAGFYIAKEKGYYKEAGLDVSIKPYSKNKNIVSDIEKQITNYAIGRPSLIIHQARFKNLAILDAVLEHSPSVLITTNPKLTHPYDLKNKKVMVMPNQIADSSFSAMLLSQGITSNDIIQQKHSLDLQDLIDGTTDAMASYISNEPFTLKEKNIKFTILNPSQYGYDIYGDLLYTSEKELNEFPQRTRKFVQASRKGWFEAFNNIEETSEFIFNNYNKQNKSLKSLIYEGNALKDLWCDNHRIGSILNYKSFEKLSDLYVLNNIIESKPDLIKFLDPLHFNREKLTIGILAKRGVDHAMEKWTPLVQHINFELSKYFISIKALSFEEIEDAVKNESIDFVLTNSMQYVQLEAKYGTSRMATLQSNSPKGLISKYGAVIFTHIDNKNINTLSNVRHKTFAAVNPVSFGGWIMAKKMFTDYSIYPEDFKSLKFLQTHDSVVEAVLNKSIEVGTVRTDTLEHLASTGKINMEDIKILHPMKHTNFPYLISTELYPEWSFAKIAKTENEVSNAILSDLLNPAHKKDALINSWSIPLNYKPIHDLLKTLKLAPYIPIKVGYKTMIEEFYIVLIILIAIMILLLFFNRYLNTMVHKRTQALQEANKALEVLAQTDELTQIANRRQFLKISEHYFNIAKRNNTPLLLLAIDIDWFKQVNDTYGHDVGDEVLKFFARTIECKLRKSDLFGRVGGEEFSILLQNTSEKDAMNLANKLRESIENTPYISEKHGEIYFTVSIGLCELSQKHNCFSELMKNADEALYKAKTQGRNKATLN